MDSEVKKQLELLGKRVFELEQQSRRYRESLASIISYLVQITEDSDDRGQVANLIRKIREEIAILERDESS